MPSRKALTASRFAAWPPTLKASCWRGSFCSPRSTACPVAAIGIADGRMVSDPERATVAVRTRLRFEWLYVRLVHTVWGM